MTTQSFISYVNALPPSSQEIMHELRQLVRDASQDVHEGLKYGVPCFTIRQNEIFSCALWPKHLTLYPVFFGAPFLAPVEDELRVYHHKRHELLFSLDESIPYELISRLCILKIEFINTWC